MGLICTARSIRLHLKPINSHYTSQQSNSHSLYGKEVSMCNISKMYHPKNDHLHANVKNCLYIFPIFFSFFFYWIMAHEGSQNIHKIKWDLWPTSWHRYVCWKWFFLSQKKESEILLKIYIQWSIHKLPIKQRWKPNASYIKYYQQTQYIKLGGVWWIPCQYHEGILMNQK